MTARQVREGRAVRIADPVATFVRFARGETQVHGAGGALIPRPVFDEPGVIASVAPKTGRTRVLLHWPDRGDVGVWIDTALLEPART